MASLTLLFYIRIAVGKLYSLWKEVAGATADVATYFGIGKAANVADVLRAVDQQPVISRRCSEPPQGLKGESGEGGDNTVGG